MTKRNKMIYWIITAFLALGMLSQGAAQILPQMEAKGFGLRATEYASR